MKQVIQKIPFVLLVAALVLPASLMAQKTEKDKVKEKKKGEQIIISTDTDTKVTVEVNDGNVTINGTPVEEYKGNDVVVLHNKIKDIRALSGMNDNFRVFAMDENRAMLGVVTDKTDKGVEITEITKGSGAEKAGLKKGDIITTIDDKKIETPDDLSKAIKSYKPGDKVTVAYLRDNKKDKVPAELSKWKGMQVYADGQQNYGLAFPDMNFERIVPRAPRAQAYNYNWNWSGGSPKMGLSVQDTEDGKGVKVIDVDGESNAEKAGIKEDDIITEVDGKAVNSADEIASVIKESKDKASVKMKLLRGGKTETVEVKIPKKLKTTDL